jgi:hypothetical protein
MDIKSEGGYVILPPSFHWEAKRLYEWDKLFPFDESNLGDNLAELPDNLVVPIPQAQKRDFSHIVQGVNSGSRNVSAAKLAGKLINSFRDDPDTAWLMLQGWNIKNTPPLDEQELWNVFHSILNRDVASNPTKYVTQK